MSKKLAVIGVGNMATATLLGITSGTDKMVDWKDIILFDAFSDKIEKYREYKRTEQDIEDALFIISDADDEDGDWDEMLPQAIEAVVEAGMASTSMLQRRLHLGYARAGRVIDQLEQKGIIGPYEGSKPRQVLITRQQWLEMRARETDGTDE